MTASEQERLYTEYHGRVLGYIRARVSNREDAEDLCADVFEKALRASGGYDAARAAQGTWLYAITRNAVIDYFRKTRPQDELPEDLADDTLPEELTDIIVLRYCDRLPLTEVALTLGMSYGAVKLRHQKALALLRREMADF